MLWPKKNSYKGFYNEKNSCGSKIHSFDKLIFSDAGNVGNFCHGKPNGNYRYLYTCYDYIACSNEIAYKMRCPAGLMYNVEKDQCDYPGNVVCILERTCKY